MRVVKFRKRIKEQITKDTLCGSLITVTLETDDFDSMAHSAIDYLEAAIKMLPEKIGEPSIVEHLYGICEGCDGRKDGFTCPAKSYIETEVLE